MTTNLHRREAPQPPPPELSESYWSSLLGEGEYVGSAPIDPYTVNGNGDEHTVYTEAVMPVNSHLYHEDEPDYHATHSEWDELQQLMDDDAILELIVTGCNRGGLMVEWQSVRGFIPASQLVDFPVTTNPTVRQRTLNARVGETLHLRIIELNEDQNRLILSERAAQAVAGGRADILARLQMGDTVDGIITNLCDFGAFVDLGGLEGLIHISELSWGRVGHPADLLQRGQTVEVYVLEVNAGAGRIALSMKRLYPDPWETVAQRYRIGEMVHGIVTNVVDFGAFARIEDGLEGLIHVSELAEGHFLHPRNVVNEGQAIHARILSIDGRARRLGLSLRGSH